MDFHVGESEPFDQMFIGDEVHFLLVGGNCYETEFIGGRLERCFQGEVVGGEIVGYRGQVLGEQCVQEGIEISVELEVERGKLFFVRETVNVEIVFFIYGVCDVADEVAIA